MKNYDEVTNDLLKRRHRYVAEQKKKRKRVMGVATSLCCFCLVALLGFGMWRGILFDSEQPIVLDNSVNTGEPDYIDEIIEQTLQDQGSQTPSTNNDSQVNSNPTNDSQLGNDSTSKHLFAINEITATISGALKYRDPELHYNESWDLAKAVEYLGVNVPNAVAALPDDLGLEYSGSGEFSIVFENNGTLVEDRMCYEFVGNDGVKITVLASKLRTPYDCLYSTDTDDMTNIRIPETDEVIPVLVYAQNKSESTMDYELYVADFEYNGIYYRVLTEDLTAYYLDSLIREIVK